MPRPREPIPLADKLARVEDTRQKLEAAEREIEQAREDFRAALIDAHEAGASYGLLGRVVGLSRQRVARIVGRE